MGTGRREESDWPQLSSDSTQYLHPGCLDAAFHHHCKLGKQTHSLAQETEPRSLRSYTLLVLEGSEDTTMTGRGRTLAQKLLLCWLAQAWGARASPTPAHTATDVSWQKRGILFTSHQGRKGHKHQPLHSAPGRRTPWLNSTDVSHLWCSLAQ